MSSTVSLQPYIERLERFSCTVRRHTEQAVKRVTMRTIPALHSPLKPPLCLCLLLVVFILGCHGVGESSFNDNKSGPVSDENADWMGRLDDDMLLSDVLIPGTHDTMTLHGGPLAKCQAWELEDQLKAGMRYLGLIIHCPIYQHEIFEYVIETVKRFLNDHKKETVLIRVQPEWFKIYKVKELVRKYIKNESIVVWVNETIPKLKEVRGKIVFGQKKPYFTLEIPFTSTDKEKDHNNKKETKKDKVSEATKGSCSKNVYLIYSNSTAKVRNLRTPKKIAKEVNPWLTEGLDKMCASRGKCVGVIAMDFPGIDLISRIINVNFK